MSARLARLRQLARTSAIRLALRYALLQVVVLAIALAALFWVVNRYVDQQIAESLTSELATLKSLPAPVLAARVAALADTRSRTRGARHYRLEDAHGHMLAGNVSHWPGGLTADGVLWQGELTVTERGDPLDNNESTPLPAVGTMLADGGRLLIAQDTGAAEDLHEVALIAAVIVLALTASIAVLLGLSLGWQWLKRIDAINRTAGQIASGDLTQRVKMTDRGDEFDLLAGHLNTMLERIEDAVAGMREVSDNVAHDLRKPLARLKTRAEVVLNKPRDTAAYQEALTQTVSDADELMRTFDALLSIARLDAGSELSGRETIDLAELTRDVAGLYADEAEDMARPFQLKLGAGILVSGSRALLAQALANLLDNAFKYSAPEAALEVQLEHVGSHAQLTVRDHGDGIPPGEHVRMIERFVRGDMARSQSGSGLGLALVNAVMHAHGGKLALSATPGGGLTAQLTLPLG
ncbi:MAG: ATP-binding protein [Thiobacillus sp.]